MAHCDVFLNALFSCLSVFVKETVEAMKPFSYTEHMYFDWQRSVWKTPRFLSNQLHSEREYNKTIRL